MGCNVYIASALTNWRVAREARDRLLAAGRRITFDWTPWAEEIEQGSAAKPDWSPEGLHEKAMHELGGVYSADHLLLILPGKRGTHTEFGACITKYLGNQPWMDRGFKNLPAMRFDRWPITLFDTKAEPDPVPTSFHYLKGIFRAESLEGAIADVLEMTEAPVSQPQLDGHNI